MAPRDALFRRLGFPDGRLTALIEYLSGGLKHAIDVKYRVTELVGISRLQIVQVLYATPLVDEDQLFHFNADGVDYVGFVDPGKKSPNFLAGHHGERVEGKPYYYSWEDLAHNSTFSPERGVGMIRFFDGPDGLRFRDKAYFETAVVAIPGAGGPDRVLTSLKWGWDNAGRRYSPAPGIYPDVYRPSEHHNVSEIFRNVLADNYPDYELAP